MSVYVWVETFTFIVANIWLLAYYPLVNGLFLISAFIAQKVRVKQGCKVMKKFSKSVFKKTKVPNVATLAYAISSMTHLKGSAILDLKMALLSRSQLSVLR